MHKYIFNVSAERMSNHPVIEQSTCSTEINHAILYFCTTYREFAKPQGALCSTYPEGRVCTQTRAEAGSREQRELGTTQTLAFRAQRPIIWTRSKSSPSDASSSGRAAAALFLAVSRFSGSVICCPDLAMRGGCTPACKEMPRYFPEKKKKTTKGIPNTMPLHLSGSKI